MMTVVGVTVLGTSACSDERAVPAEPSYLFVFHASEATMEPVVGATGTFRFAGGLDCIENST
jgi:hypothetical protein